MWQWSVPVASAVSEETREPPRAFLWVPPTCARVRAVVVGQHNMLEEPLFENPVFWTAVRNTFYFALVGGPLTVAVSLAAALLVNARLVRFRTRARAGPEHRSRSL